MNIAAIYLYLPLVALIGGAIAGLVFGRFFGVRLLLWLLGAIGAVALLLVIYLTTIGPGEEQAAFVPFAALTGLVFPAIFGAIMGGVAGRALGGRAGRR
ncbi:hypothetical protein [Jhaorihella thermophila]|uniref:Major facilitator superfamily (MFS) profile domain-containing protein n=1 Tax=Jhaorihella thermophila TaxID=488547 RepID=A0A1H5TY81_9RHOB|nr:hypothetical protein [Jhaorihella thermophila]SEF67743.1 hypothetical protein SAMN05421751_10394 [Jhaorihella thermophila]